MTWLILGLLLMAMVGYLAIARMNERRYDPDNRAETIIGFQSGWHYEEPTMEDELSKLEQITAKGPLNKRSSD